MILQNQITFTLMRFSIVDKTLKSLSFRERDYIKKKYLKNMTIGEIAKSSNATKSRVRWILAQAEHKLSALYKDYE